MGHEIIALLIVGSLQADPINAIEQHNKYGISLMDVKKKKKKGKKIGGSKGKKSKKGFFSKIFGSK